MVGSSPRILSDVQTLKEKGMGGSMRMRGEKRLRLTYISDRSKKSVREEEAITERQLSLFDQTRRIRR